MVSRKAQVIGRSMTTREVIVDGLLGGLFAGLAMIGVLILLSLLRGEPPGALLGRFSGGEAVSPLMGLLRHEGVSVVYGMLFGVVSRPLLNRYPGRLAALLIGVLYGLALFALAELVILPDTASPLREVPFAIFGAGHLVYGVVLGEFIHNQKGV